MEKMNLFVSEETKTELFGPIFPTMKPHSGRILHLNDGKLIFSTLQFCAVRINPMKCVEVCGHHVALFKRLHCIYGFDQVPIILVYLALKKPTAARKKHACFCTFAPEYPKNILERLACLDLDFLVCRLK